MAEINIPRTISGFPHCGRVFLCDDVYGIVDEWKAIDAYRFALTNGVEFINASSRSFNMGNVFSAGNQMLQIQSTPVVGVESLIYAFVDSGYYSADALGEMTPSLTGFSLNLSFRMLTKEEYATFVNGSTGFGFASQRITFRLINDAINGPSNGVQLIDIFADYNYYVSNNIGIVPPLNQTNRYIIDLQTDGRGLQVGGIQNLTVIGEIPPVMQAARACQARVNMAYEMRRDSNGNVWSSPPSVQQSLVPNTGNAILDSATFDKALDPATGATVGGAGILSCNLSLFHEGLLQQLGGTLASPTSYNQAGSRVITAMPVTADPEMGSTIDVLTFSNLRFYGRSAVNSPWPAISLMSHNLGGVQKPIIGHSGRFTETDEPVQQLEMPIQVPHGATSYTVIAKIRANTTIPSGFHNLTCILSNSANTASQTIINESSAVYNGVRFVYFSGALSGPMQPVSGVVEQYKLAFKSEKTVPNTNEVIQPYYVDGFLAFYLAFWT